MTGNVRPILVNMIILSICLMVPSYGFAQNDKWEDFTKPYPQVIEVRLNKQIEVVLPEYLLKEFKELELIITSNGLGRFYGLNKRGLLKINGASEWDGYTIRGHATSTDQASNTIKIATKDLRPGLNLFQFTRKDGTQYSGNEYKITELRFNIPNIEEIQARNRKNPAPSSVKVKDSSMESVQSRQKKLIPVTAQKKAQRDQQVSQNQVIGKKSKTLQEKPQARVSTKIQSRQKHKDKNDVAEVKSLEASFPKTTRLYLQHALQQLDHYQGKVDGAFGPGTRSAIKAYQKSQGKPATGYLEKADVSSLLALGRVVFEKGEVERKYKEKEAKRLAKEKAERKRQEDEARRLAQIKSHKIAREEAERKQKESAAAERKRQEEEARRIARQEAERNQLLDEKRRKAQAEAQHKRDAEEARRKVKAEAEHKQQQEEKRRQAEAKAQQKQQEEASRRLADQRAAAQQEAQKEREELKLQLKAELKAELQDQVKIELEKKKRLQARHSKNSNSTIKFAGPAVTFNKLSSEVGCGSQDSATVQNEKFSRRYKDKIFVLTGQIIAIKQTRVLMDFDDGTADIEIDLIPGQNNSELKRKIVTVEFVMKKKGGCFALFYGDRGIVNEVKTEKGLISQKRINE